MNNNNKLQNIFKLFQSLDINQTVHNIFNYFNNQISSCVAIKSSAFYKYYHKTNDFKPLITRNISIDQNIHDSLTKVIRTGIPQIQDNELYIPLIFLNKALGVMYIKAEKELKNIISSRDLKLDIDLCSLIYYNSNIYSIAIKDELTRLYNIRYFNYKINEVYEVLKHSNKKFSIIMMDIDYFKHYNDKYGHQVGDNILKILAIKINKTIGKEGIVARYGGEEFIVLLPYYNSQRAYSLGERIRKKIEDFTIKNDDFFWKVTISLGISTYPDHSDSIPQLIHYADHALYQSKANGRNQVSLYGTLNKI